MVPINIKSCLGDFSPEEIRSYRLTEISADSYLAHRINQNEIDEL
jgi:hypothetical protein